jgi:suppressor of G2 allele of SKP1
MAAKLIVDANCAFIDEDFETAVELYTQAIDLEPSSDAYSSRAAVHLKMENWTEAVADATAAIKMQSTNSKAHLRKGIACFNLGEFVSAKKAFNDGLALDNLTDKKLFQTWLRKCDAELDDSAPPARIPLVPTGPAPAPAPAPAVAQVNAAVLAPPQKPSARFRHDWIQSPSHVTVNVYIKGSNSENCHVDLDEREVTLERVLSKDDSWQMQLELWAAIVPSESKIEFGSTKVEL